MLKKFKKVLLAGALVCATVIGSLSFGQGSASAAPAFSMPFPCNQTWSANTRTNHSPTDAVDLSRADALGDTVVASASGTVSTVRDLGGTSYGKYIVIDHGGGWQTLYAHLNGFSVSAGQSVSKGQKIGYVGSTGNSTGAHLHYEQKYNGSVQKVVWEGAQILYYGTKSYTSKNTCSTSGTNPTGTINTESGIALTVRSGPGTGYSAVGTVADGARVTIYCQKKGTSVTGTYGTTTLWDKIGDGRYVSDAYVYTGSDGQVAPTCP